MLTASFRKVALIQRMSEQKLHLNTVCAAALPCNTGVCQRYSTDCFLHTLQTHDSLICRPLSRPQASIPTFPYLIGDHRVDFEVTRSSHGRYSLYTEYGRGNQIPDVEFSLACVDGSRLEEVAIFPQFLRIWENPETSGNWAILVVLRNGNRCLFEQHTLEKIQYMYKVPIFILNPNSEDSVLSVFRHIAHYAAAMTGKVPFSHVFPGRERNEVKITELLQSLESTSRPDLGAAAYHIDCVKLNKEAQKLLRSMGLAAASTYALAPLDTALRVHSYLRQALWARAVDVDAVAREVRRRVCAGQLGGEWAWRWARNGGGWGEKFGGCGLGVSGVRSRAMGVPVAEDKAGDARVLTGQDLYKSILAMSGRTTCRQEIKASTNTSKQQQRSTSAAVMELAFAELGLRAPAAESDEGRKAVLDWAALPDGCVFHYASVRLDGGAELQPLGLAKRKGHAMGVMEMVRDMGRTAYVLQGDMSAIGPLVHDTPNEAPPFQLYQWK